MSQRHRVPLPVDDADVRRAVAARCQRAGSMRWSAVPAWAPDLGGELARVFLGGEPVHRIPHDGRIAEVLEAVGEGASDRFGPRVQPARRPPTDRARRELLEDVQDLERRDAPRGPGRERELEPTVGADERWPDPHLVGGEILSRDQPSVGGHRVDDPYSYRDT